MNQRKKKTVSDNSGVREVGWREVRKELSYISRACNYMEVSENNNQDIKANKHAGKGRYAIPMGMGHPARPAQVTPAHPSRL